jgi:hypothetical protein
MRTGPDGNDDPRSFVTRGDHRAVKKLWAFRTAQRISTDPKQKLTCARLRYFFFNKFDLFVPNECGNPATGWNHLTNKFSGSCPGKGLLSMRIYRGAFEVFYPVGQAPSG